MSRRRSIPPRRGKHDLRDLGLDVLTTPQAAIFWACEELGGGGIEHEVQQAAVKYDDAVVLPIDPVRPDRTVHNRYSGAPDGLEAKGLVTQQNIGRHHYIWLTQETWEALGHDEPMRRQEGLF